MEVTCSFDGPAIEDHDFYDAFVIGKKSDGVYIGVLTGKKVTPPVITKITPTMAQVYVRRA